MADENKEDTGAAGAPAEGAPADDPEVKFFALMDKWADAREANRPRNKTNAPQPRSILDELFGR